MKSAKLKVLFDEYTNCAKCDLHKERKQIVFGKGSENAQIVLLAEAPGKNEDEQGLPFVGQAGKMLDKMIQAMGLKTEDVYILNSCLCRPPNNRKPTAGEIAACSDRLHKQLDIIQPKVIVALGASAAEALLGPGGSLASRRGAWHSYRDIPVRVTYHPAALLYNASQKPAAAEDLKQVLAFLES